jgi:hypothetical protein
MTGDRLIMNDVGSTVLSIVVVILLCKVLFTKAAIIYYLYRKGM